MRLHLYSLGAGSWNATRIDMRENPGAEHRLLYTDTLYEDADAYRFGLQGALHLFGRPYDWVPAAEDFPDFRVSPDTPIEDYAGNPAWRAFLAQLRDRAAEAIPELEWVVEGRDIWEVFRDERFLGNDRIDPCSKVTKRKPRERWMKANCDPADTVVTVGIGPDEAHRYDNGKGQGFKPRMAKEGGWVVHAPLLGRIEGALNANLYVANAGLTPARLYAQGYPHNNCGGMCCKQGKAAILHRLRVDPVRAEYDALMERKLIAYLDKPIAMYSRTVGDVSVPFTRDELHAEQAANPQTDLLMFMEPGDTGCGCAL